MWKTLSQRPQIDGKSSQISHPFGFQQGQSVVFFNSWNTPFGGVVKKRTGFLRAGTAKMSMKTDRRISNDPWVSSNLDHDVQLL
jgi:hypothetical protein